MKQIWGEKMSFSFAQTYSNRKNNLKNKKIRKI